MLTKTKVRQAHLKNLAWSDEEEAAGTVNFLFLLPGCQRVHRCRPVPLGISLLVLLVLVLFFLKQSQLRKAVM